MIISSIITNFASIYLLSEEQSCLFFLLLSTVTVSLDPGSDGAIPQDGSEQRSVKVKAFYNAFQKSCHFQSHNGTLFH